MHVILITFPVHAYSASSLPSPKGGREKHVFKWSKSANVFLRSFQEKADCETHTGQSKFLSGLIHFAMAAKRQTSVREPRTVLKQSMLAH